MMVIWPKVFTDENFKYEGKHIKDEALADGLTGWGNCMAGGMPPETFGKGIVKIGKVLNILPTAENLSARADKIIKKEAI